MPSVERRAPRSTPGRCPGAVQAIVLAAAIGLLGVTASCAHARPSVGERVVHHERSSFGEIWVLEHDGTRYLRFAREGVDQSAVRLGDPTWLEFTYTRALLAAFAIAPSVRRVLVVGLGGGTIPMLLRRIIPEAEVDVVELDPRVAAVAQAHLGFTPGPGLRVHIADGRHFLENASATWDVIVLDAYGADAIPLTLATREFLDAVRARLAPGGLVAANLWGENANPLYRAMLRTYEDVFPEVHVVRGELGASRIVIAPAAVAGWNRAAFEGAAAALADRWSLRFDLHAIVVQGYEPPGTHPGGDAPLRDAAAAPAPTSAGPSPRAGAPDRPAWVAP